MIYYIIIKYGFWFSIFFNCKFLSCDSAGSTISLIITNSLKSGIKAGLLNVLRTQMGVLILVLLLATGFKIFSPFLDNIIKIVRLFGSIYLVFLGVIAFRSKINLDNQKLIKFEKKYLLQGLVVILTNPKIFLFLGAFIPQFVSLDHSVEIQIIYYGFIFIFVATIFDSTYAFVLCTVK